ncbi:MAG: abortive infection system antitoxin AbiGi family protein [Candidatus Fimenecus sp.]
MDNVGTLLLGSASYTNSKRKKRHTPSTIQADTLFTFTSQLDFLLPSLKTRMLSPRYCPEDISYLKIRKLKKVAYPMKCFCDINMHRLGVHLEWYGYYGLAFSKEWGMQNGIQPVQYINPDSDLRKDFSDAFSSALKAPAEKESLLQSKMKDFLFHEMMYYKPYEGKMENRNTEKIENKCFTDECEWRYIPDVTVAGFEQAYYDEKIFAADILPQISNSMQGIPEISLHFEYSDVKYIIIKTVADFEIITDLIASLGLDETEERLLISKILIWDNSRGDF